MSDTKPWQFTSEKIATIINKFTAEANEIKTRKRLSKKAVNTLLELQDKIIPHYQKQYNETLLKERKK